MHHVQSVNFPTDQWNKPTARAWLEAHDFKYTSVDEKKNFLHFRQLDPKGFNRFYTYPIDHDGKKIDLVLGYR